MCKCTYSGKRITQLCFIPHAKVEVYIGTYSIIMWSAYKGYGKTLLNLSINHVKLQKKTDVESGLVHGYCWYWHWLQHRPKALFTWEHDFTTTIINAVHWHNRATIVPTVIIFMPCCHAPVMTDLHDCRRSSINHHAFVMHLASAYN